MAIPKNIDWSVYTPFQQKVLKFICSIPAGQVMTYGQVAQAIGSPGSARAVGNALGKNQHAPQVPCHRVVGYNSLGGFSAVGGVKTKLKRLKNEGFTVKNRYDI
jgi:methylated-DNA-[protein]-cysteine S-methyltransferase